MRACVLGSTNVDLVVAVAALPRPGETVPAAGSHRAAGGKGANQATALARLGADVVFVSAVGADEAGDWSQEQFTSEGIDLADVMVLAGAPTGLAVVAVDDAGENTIVVVAGANDHVIPPSSYDGLDVLLLSLEVPVRPAGRAVTEGRSTWEVCGFTRVPVGVSPHTCRGRVPYPGRCAEPRGSPSA